MDKKTSKRIDEAVEEEAKKIVQNSFARKNPEQMIKDAVYTSDYFHGKAFNKVVIEAVGKLLAERIDLTINNAFNKKEIVK